MTDQEVNESLQNLGVADYLRNVGRAGLVEGWRKFVEEIEAGYKFGLDDYCNDLDLRDIIESVGLGKDADVLALDNCLAAQLTHKERKIWSSQHSSAFWIYGYPKRIAPEFEADLQWLKSNA